ncbi:MAG TPA: dihydroneopterin aldolase [Armatimonadota bacterium]|nr:dihydroneopterin aldolase [Armatimonadota bacterium]
MDRILIEDLVARCVLGVSAQERREKQEVVINLALATDTRTAGKSDRFADAVDYRAIKKRVLAAVEESQFHLVEALAQRVAEICLDHPGVREAQVTVSKPSALRFARSVGVRITRCRG